jgi:hypothetical protein
MTRLNEWLEAQITDAWVMVKAFCHGFMKGIRSRAD